jgi:hypothetical protein
VPQARTSSQGTMAVISSPWGRRARQVPMLGMSACPSACGNGRRWSWMMRDSCDLGVDWRGVR